MHINSKLFFSTNTNLYLLTSLVEWGSLKETLLWILTSVAIIRSIFRPTPLRLRRAVCLKRVLFSLLPPLFSVSVCLSCSSLHLITRDRWMDLGDVFVFGNFYFEQQQLSSAASFVFVSIFLINKSIQQDWRGKEEMVAALW